MRMEQAGKFPGGFHSTGDGKEMTEVEKQAESVRLRKPAARLVPSLHELGSVLGRREKGLQGRNGVVIESQVSRVELLLQDGHSGEQRERFPFHSVRRPKQDLAFAFEHRTRHPAADVFGERQRSVVEGQMEVGAVQRSTPDVVHPLLIQADGMQARVQDPGGARAVVDLTFGDLSFRGSFLSVRNAGEQAKCQREHSPRLGQHLGHLRSPLCRC